MNQVITHEMRETFDEMLEGVLKSLPSEAIQLLEEIPVIVDDEPSEALLREMEMASGPGESDLCGLHWGVPLGERSVMDGEPGLDRIQIFRGPIFRLSGRSKKTLREQIRITVIHELAHHFGMDEDQLEDLGYG